MPEESASPAGSPARGCEVVDGRLTQVLLHQGDVGLLGDRPERFVELGGGRREVVRPVPDLSDVLEERSVHVVPEADGEDNDVAICGPSCLFKRVRDGLRGAAPRRAA